MGEFWLGVLVYFWDVGIGLLGLGKGRVSSGEELEMGSGAGDLWTRRVI
jgi:hypothetical protein